MKYCKQMRTKEMFRGALLGGVLNVECAYLSLWMQVQEYIFNVWINDFFVNQ